MEDPHLNPAVIVMVDLIDVTEMEIVTIAGIISLDLDVNNVHQDIH